MPVTISMFTSTTNEVNKCSWLLGAVKNTWGQDSFCSAFSVGSFNLKVLRNARHSHARGSMGLIIFHGQDHEIMCHGAAVL